MNIIPFVHEGLGNSSYLVQLGEVEAALVDPDRNVERYLDCARSLGWNITSIFETHLHADFVSGALEAAHATDARVYVPVDAQALFPHIPLGAGQQVTLSGVKVEPIDSPGHTPEHLSYVFSVAGQPSVLFSGGALIVGGAARTDLISPQMTESLTRAEHRTLRTAFSTLGDETLLYPTHGGGSFCSAGAGGSRTSTLGAERLGNPLLSIVDEEEFVSWFPSTFPPAVPDYFYRMRPINRAGPRLRGEITPPPRLSPAEFDAARSHHLPRGEQALVVDVRPFEEYAETHITGSLSNPFRDAYATFLGWVVSSEIPILFVAGDVTLARVIDESLLVGYERFAGWLDGGMEAWVASGRPVRCFELVGAGQAHKALLEGVAILDVREQGEFESGHIEGAINISVGKLQSHLDQVPRDRPILAYCGHGERSSTALSFLESEGIGPLLNLDGRMGAWKEDGYKVG